MWAMTIGRRLLMNAHGDLAARRISQIGRHNLPQDDVAVLGKRAEAVRIDSSHDDRDRVALSSIARISAERAFSGEPAAGYAQEAGVTSVWQYSQSPLIVDPSFAVWLSSWHRKQPVDVR